MKSNPAELAIDEARQLEAEQQIVLVSKKIEFYVTEYSVEVLVLKMNKDELVIPQYQREDTWEAERKSRFIESLLMGLPIPFLFFWEMQDGNLEIVDGSQRLRSITQFLGDEFRLEELDQLTALEGFRFSDLSESRQKKVKNRSIRGIILNEKADEKSRFEVFDRINTGSKIANQAEVRRGVLTGPFQKLVIELAEDPAFCALAPTSDNMRKLRERDELITRFFAYGDGLEEYRDRPSDYLFDYTKKMNEAFEKNDKMIDAYRLRFEQMVVFVQKAFPYGFYRSKTANKKTPRTRFEALAIGSYKALQQKPELLEAPPPTEWIESDEFTGMVRADGANAKNRLKARIDFVRKKLVGDDD